MCKIHDSVILVEYWYFIGVSSHSYIGHCSKQRVSVKNTASKQMVSVAQEKVWLGELTVPQ